MTTKKTTKANKQKALMREEFRKLAYEIKKITRWELRFIFEKIEMQQKKGENIMADRSSPDGLQLEALRKIHTRVTDPRFRNLTPEQYEDLLMQKEENQELNEEEKRKLQEENKRLKNMLNTQEKLLLAMERRIQLLLKESGNKRKSDTGDK